MFSQNCPYPKWPKGEVYIKKIFSFLRLLRKKGKLYAKNAPCREWSGECLQKLQVRFIKCVPPAGPSGQAGGTFNERRRCRFYGGDRSSELGFIVLSGHFRVRDELYGEILRYGALRQQLCHDDQPHFAGIGRVMPAAAGGKG